MPNVKLALVIDKSEAFLSFQKERILESWRTDLKSAKKIDRFINAGGATLFGGGTTSLLEISDAEQIKQLVVDLQQSETDGSLEGKLGAGVLITATVARTSTKKAEALVAQLGGLVLTTAVDKKANVSIAEKMISELNLNRNTKSFLLAYVGDDYEAVIPLVKTLSPLSAEQQNRVTEEEIFVRLPQPPGAVAPWEIEKPLLAGDLTKTIDVFRRISAHSHLLVVLKILNNKFQASYRVSALLEANPRMSDDELAQATGVNARTLWLHKNNHKKYGTARLQEAASLLMRTEQKVKGGMAADASVVMEAMLVRMSLVLKG